MSRSFVISFWLIFYIRDFIQSWKITLCEKEIAWNSKWVDSIPFLAHPSRIHRGNMKLTSMLIHLSWEANTLPPQICSKENWSLKKEKKKTKLRHNGQNLSIQLEELLCKIRLALPLVLASALLQVWPQLNKMWVERCEIRLHTRCGGCRGFPRWSLVKQVPLDPPTQSPAAHSQMSTDTKSTIKKFKMHWKG